MKKSLILVILLSATINNSAINQRIFKKNLYQAGTLLGLGVFTAGTQLIAPYSFYGVPGDLTIAGKKSDTKTLRNIGLPLMVLGLLGMKYCYDRI